MHVPNRLEYFHLNGVRCADLEKPEQLPQVAMWHRDGDTGELYLRRVGVWVITTGVQADNPMRVKLNRGLPPSAERGCGDCGIVARKGEHNANKYLGYSEPSECDVRYKTGTCGDLAQRMPMVLSPGSQRLYATAETMQCTPCT